MWAASQHPQIEENERGGFTIVELLIVIVVIGILAAITIVAYNGVTQQAKVASIKSDLDGAAKQLNIDQVNSSAYPATLAAANNGQGVKASPGTTYQYSVNNSANPQTFCITATNGTTSYFVSSSNNVPQAGGCPGHGVGGVPPITNLAPNPGAESDLSSVTSYSVTVSRSFLWSAGGASSFDTTPSYSSDDSFFDLGGDVYTGFQLGFQAGHTYTISATVHLAAPQTGSLGDLGNGARQVTAWYTASDGTNTEVKGNAAPNAAGDTRSSVTFTIPLGATGAWVRFYNGATSGNGDVWFDNIMITEGATQYNYADGNSPNWVWNGTPNASTSTGPQL